MKPKKSYGQHFLTSEHIANRIAESLSGKAGYQQILEVGPGKGMLTQFLLKRPFQLKVVEADRDMVEYLEKNFPDLAPSIISANFLRVQLDEVMEQQPFGLIGNFPYNISSQILFKLVEYRHLIPEMAGMFQWELAERVVAPPGNKSYGVISVLVQAYYSGQLLFKVKKGAFFPPPKVESAVIHLERNATYELDCDERFFRSVVKLAFGQRRKMLRNTLKALIGEHPFQKDPFLQQRPEQLSVADFVELTQRLTELRELNQATED